MPAELYINDGGTWRWIQETYVNDAGTWRRIQEIYVNDGGTWRSVFVGDLIALTNDSDTHIVTQPANAAASFGLTNTGFRSKHTGTTGVPWITPQVNMANYSVFCTVLSGTLTSGSATGTWLNLGTSQSWVRNATTNGTFQAVIRLQIRRDSDGVVLATADITLTATRDPG